MSTEIRALEPGDHLEHRHVMQQAFGKGAVVTPPAPDAPAPDINGTWGIFDGGRECAALTIVPFQTHWQKDKIIPLGGIAGVATRPEARGQGYVDALLRHSLRTMRDAGQVISALYPFSWSFYRRYGWDWVGEKRQVTIPLREIRVSSDAVCRVGDVTEQNAKDLLAPIYSAFARDYRGVFTTETHRWKEVLNHDDSRTTYAYRHQSDNGIGSSSDGYLLWRYNKDKSARIRELVANSPAAWEGLLSLLHHFATQCDKAVVSLPADTTLFSYLMHWDMETRIEPIFMARVVDVAAAIRQLSRLSGELVNGTATVAVQDEHAPWNTGNWRITSEDGVITCAAGAATDAADLTLDINAFSQAFWGTPSLERLRRSGRVSVADEKGYQFLTQLLPSATVYCLDGF